MMTFEPSTDICPGRIVPSEQSPLCHPRYGYSAIKMNGGLIKFAPNHRAGVPEQWDPATQDGYVAQDIDGKLCQIVDGEVKPLREVNGALSLYMPAPNLSVTATNALVPVQRPAAVSGAHQREQVIPAEPSISAQITALDLEYAKLEHELKNLNKAEVIHGRTMTRAAKQDLVDQRIGLVTSMDKVRKALKALKTQPPPNAPTSPRAMQPRHSVSPPGRQQRLPPFLQMSQSTSVPVQQQGYPYAPPPGFATQYRPIPSPEDMYASNPWVNPPPGMYIAPPFDGSMSGPALSSLPPIIASATAPVPPGSLGSQHDGTQSVNGSLCNLKHESPRNRAVSIKAPEAKAAANLRSGLNPMSPVYKPGFPATTTDKAASVVSNTLAPTQQLKPTTVAATDETASPAKKDNHLRSSSISSFETADFFPRNPEEYSTRPHGYPHRTDSSDKENAALKGNNGHPITPGLDNGVSIWKAGAPDTGDHNGKVPPPGTPVFHSDATTLAPLPSNVYDTAAAVQQQVDIPNRNAHNISPKSKRDWLFVEEHPGGRQGSSSPEDNGDTDTIDFTRKSRAWLEGYQAGLQRHEMPKRDMDGEKLLGYIQGLMKSTKMNAAPSVETSTGSPIKAYSRRPSPALPLRTNSRVQPAEKASYAGRPLLETNTRSLDTFKQAVFAPQNKNAVLTPSAEGPHISEAPANLGAWAKNHSSPSGPATASDSLPEHFIPKRAVALDRQGIMSEGNNDGCSNDKISSKARSSEGAGHYLVPSSKQVPLPASPTTSTRSIASSSIASGGAPDTGNRASGLGSIDSSMYRAWPGNRTMTPTEWKTSASLTHVAKLATGYFAFDGTSDPTLRVPGQLTRDVVGAPQRITSDSIMSQGGRFREGSLDGITSPPMSPTISPNGTPVKDSGKKKNPSPTKAKFEHVAERMGIKITSSEKQEPGNDGALDPAARGKRSAWRDL